MQKFTFSLREKHRTKTHRQVHNLSISTNDGTTAAAAAAKTAATITEEDGKGG
jgi:hypothetical protein